MRPTLKQKKFVKNYLESGNGKLSAIKAGYSPKTAEVIASENLRKPNLRDYILKVLDEAGLTDEQLAIKLALAIDTGLGQKPTNADALRGIELVHKLRDSFPVERRFNANLNISNEYENKSNEELEQELVKIQKDNRELLEQIKQRRQV